MLFLVMGFVCLFYKNKFMLISGGHILNRSISKSVHWLVGMVTKEVLFSF